MEEKDRKDYDEYINKLISFIERIESETIDVDMANKIKIFLVREGIWRLE